VTVRQQRAPGLRDIGFAVDHVDGRSFRTLRSSHVSKLSSASALKDALPKGGEGGSFERMAPGSRGAMHRVTGGD
jgi:hypothetical protein